MSIKPNERKSKAMAYLMLIMGIFKLTDWLYGGLADFGDAISGVGFLLMFLTALADSDPDIASRFRLAESPSLMKLIRYSGFALAIVGLIIG